jgi:hypothetical protein
MRQSSLPEVPRGALRDYGKGPHIERGWRRLEQELGSVQVQRHSPLWWAPALAAVTFGAGLFVGANFLHEQPLQAPLVAEPTVSPRPVAGAPARPARDPETQVERSKTPPARVPRAAGLSPEVELAAPLVVAAEPRDPPPVVPAGPPEWEQLANSGDFALAKRALDRAGGFDAVLASLAPGQLMTLVDIARASGNRDQALRALRRLLEIYPGADEAPLATWTLANLLDQSGDTAGAAEAYALYRRLSPTGDFAEDAAAREVQFALSQGNVERAAALVEEYARSFPKSRRTSSLRAQLRALSNPVVVAEGPAKTVPVDSDDAEELDEAPPLEPGQ